MGPFLAQEAAALFNLGIGPEIYWGWPRWRRKLALLGLALRIKRESEHSGSYPGQALQGR